MKKMSMLLITVMLACSLMACSHKDAAAQNNEEITETTDNAADTEVVDEVREAENEEIDSDDIPAE